MQGIAGDYFILQDLKDFGLRQTCPKTFWKNLWISAGRDPFRQAACANFAKEKSESTWSGTLGEIKWLWYTRIPLFRISCRRKMDKTTLNRLNLCCHQWWGWLPLWEIWNCGGLLPIYGKQKGGCGSGHTSFYQQNRSSFTKRSVERMGNASDMNTRHFSGE